MDHRLYVDLDHVEALEHDWLYVVLEAPTGVVYEIQHAGLACLHAQIEGHLIPTESTLGYPALIDLFVTRLQGTWASMDRLPEHLDALRAAVAHIAIPVGTSPGDFSQMLSPIAVDETRLAEATEAHIPVTTEFGPGILVWSNSD
ncbi:DUF6210 family protein [Streptodolium elevatio]|uniref:DUF6210 family protein n=1 Tax=Streptodolium elevatio TaxID=3157996 RepID=A0ABV3DHS4_9ACTN